MWGAEMGVNEHGVAIGNEAVFTREAVPKHGGLLGMDLLRLGLERAATAEEAVAVMRELLSRHGQGGQCGYEDRGFRYSSSFLVADPGGAWVLETAGRDSAVEKVSGARAISNGLTIAGFAARHSDRLKTSVSACRLRRQRTESFAQSAETPRDLAHALRDHGATPWPEYEWFRGAMRAPCMHAGGLLAASQTTASFILELGAGGVRGWATATSAPCLSVFKPFRVGEPLAIGPVPGREPDDSLWWSHERLHRLTMRDAPRLLPLFAGERDQLERRFFDTELDRQAAWDEARAATARWTGLVAAAAGADRRPFAIRRYWRRQRAVRPAD